MGTKYVEEFLARSGLGRCADLKETAEILSKVAFKASLNIVPTVGNWSVDGKEFSLFFDENPLTEFVELPESVQNSLFYCNILCGLLRGAFEMVHS